MTVLSLASLTKRPPVAWRRAIAGVSGGWLFVLLGVELTALVALWPETLRTWWQADDTGDFRNFLSLGRELRVGGMYSPALSLLMRPLTYVSAENAYRIYVGLGIVALIAVAYVAQRGVASPTGRLAIALGTLAVPQMHWALRLGHMTAFLALAALGGFVLLRRRPLLAGLCLSLLVLKPQYAPIPALYLLWTKNGRALAGLLAGAAALEVAGFAAVGFDSIGPYLGRILAWGADSSDKLLPVQQSWQYAWPGFLISAGLDPNPLVVFDLLLLSLGAVVLVWVRGDRSLGPPAAALGMLLVTPYSNFYDWGLLVVAGALLLRAEVRWRWTLAVALAALYAALLASQAGTPWPVAGWADTMEAQGQALASPIVASGTRGLYWITPVALAAVCFLGLSAPSREVGAAREVSSPLTEDRPTIPRAARGASFALAGALLCLAYFASAFVVHVAPFTRHRDAYSQSAVLREVPPGFPLPPDSKLTLAGKGAELPYHVEWASQEPVSEVAGIYRRMLNGGSWELMLDESTGGSYRVRVSRLTLDGSMTHWAMLDVSPQAPGTRVSLDFMVTQGFNIAPAANTRD